MALTSGASTPAILMLIVWSFNSEGVYALQRELAWSIRWGGQENHSRIVLNQGLPFVVSGTERNLKG